MLARWSAPVTPSAFQITDADLAARLRLWSSRRVETSFLATANYDHTTFSSMANAASTVRLQVGTTSPVHGFQWAAGVDGWRSTLNGSGVIVPATSISGWIRRFGLSFIGELSARALPGSMTTRGDTIGHQWDFDSASVARAASYSVDTLTGQPTPIFPFVPGAPIYGTRKVSDGHTFGDASLRVSGALMSFGIDGLAGVGVATGGRKGEDRV